MTKPIDPAAFADDMPATDADLAAAASAAAPAAAGDPDPDFTPVPLRPRPTGWTVFRQRRFLEVLAATGSVTNAAREAGASLRSAYRLRQRPDGQSFAAAWDRAITVATHSLLECAIQRATSGVARGVWRDGERVGTELVPSDRLLIFLLQHLEPTRFGRLSGITPVPVPDVLKKAERELPHAAADLADLPLPARPDAHERFDDLPDEPAPTRAHIRARTDMRAPARAQPRTRARA